MRLQQILIRPPFTLINKRAVLCVRRFAIRSMVSLTMISLMTIARSSVLEHGKLRRTLSEEKFNRFQLSSGYFYLVSWLSISLMSHHYFLCLLAFSPLLQYPICGNQKKLYNVDFNVETVLFPFSFPFTNFYVFFCRFSFSLPCFSFLLSRA